MSLPTARLLITVALFAGLCAACGKKGPPLAPFPRVPAKVESLAVTRIGRDIYLTFPVPVANIDGRKPADLSELKVFAITTTRAPETEEEREAATLVGTLAVRPVLPSPPPDAGDAVTVVTSTLPGLDQGSQAVFFETLTDALQVPVELPAKKNGVIPVEPSEPPPGPLVAPPEHETARRYYFVTAVSPRGREGPPSAVVSVPFGNVSDAPGQPIFESSETALTVRWEPSPNARTWTIAPVLPPAPPAPKPTTPEVELATDPSAPTPPAPPALPALPAKSLGFTSQATLYSLYEVLPQTATSTSAPQLPKPVTPQPIAANEFVLKPITFGQERCFYVRAVDVVFGMPVQGPASPQSCVTPRDTFPPRAPRNLAAIAGGGVINLIWDANTEADLAGYLVLRGEAAGGRLQPLMPAPIRETTFPDRTAQPGVRYVYVVIAVDTADPPNQSAPSNRTEETARQ